MHNMETPTATVKSIQIIKVENGYVVSAVGRSHIAKDVEDVKQHIIDGLPDVLKALDEEPPPPQPQRQPIHPGNRPEPKIVAA
jgi:hypothetical protein